MHDFWLTSSEEAGELVHVIRWDPIQMLLCPTTDALCDPRHGTKKMLEELHEGVCSLHISGRALAVAAI